MLYELLPEIYRDEETRKFIEILDKVLKDVELDIEKLWTLIDPDRCPKELLPYLAGTLGWNLIGNVEESWRLQVRYAQQILKAGGRAEAIVLLLRSFGLRVTSVLQIWKHILTGEVRFVPYDKPEQRPPVLPDCSAWCPTSDVLIGVEPVASWSEEYWRILDQVFREAKIPIHVRSGFALTTRVGCEISVGAISETSTSVKVRNELGFETTVEVPYVVSTVAETSAEVVVNA